MKKQKDMYNWDKYRRMQCNIEKATVNESVASLTTKHYQQLQKVLVHSPEDQAIFNDTFLKLTYRYNPDRDFVEQFKQIFSQLKGAYYRDSKCNIHYQLEEDRLNIPIPFEDTIEASKDTSFIDRLKAILNV